jgi:hypothetical protein
MFYEHLKPKSKPRALNDFLNQIRSIVNFKVHDVYNFNEVIIDFEQPFNIVRKVLIF